MAAAHARRSHRAAACRRQHPGHRRVRRAPCRGPPHSGSRVGGGVALRARDARCLRAHRRRDDDTPRRGRPGRRRVPRPARRDGHRASGRRRRRDPRARTAHRGPARPRDREPRSARERDARDDGIRGRHGRLPHVPAHRHGADRHARRAAARAHARRRTAAGPRDATARLPHRPVVAVDVHRARPAAVRDARPPRARARRDAVVRARVPDGGLSRVPDDGVRLRPRRRGGGTRGRRPWPTR